MLAVCTLALKTETKDLKLSPLAVDTISSDEETADRLDFHIWHELIELEPSNISDTLAAHISCRAL